MAASKKTELQVVTDAPAPATTEGATILGMIDRLIKMPEVPVEKLEQLFALHQKVEADKARRSYAVALAALQSKLEAVVRRGAITVEKTVRSKYAKWEDINDVIKPLLTEHGFAMSFGIDNASPERLTVTCTLLHCEGHTESTSMALGIDNSGGKNNPQGWGSAVSYAKRYTATAILNISSRDEDDDGEAAGAAPTITDEQQELLKELVLDTDSHPEKFLAFAKADSFAAIKASQFPELEKMLKTKQRKMAAGQ